MKNDKFMHEISERLLLLRGLYGYTATCVADTIGVSVDQYCKMERGARGITLVNCAKLAKLYNVSCDFIINGCKDVNAVLVSRDVARGVSGLMREAMKKLDEAFVALEEVRHDETV